MAAAGNEQLLEEIVGSQHHRSFRISLFPLDVTAELLGEAFDQAGRRDRSQPVEDQSLGRHQRPSGEAPQGANFVMWLCLPRFSMSFRALFPVFEANHPPQRDPRLAADAEAGSIALPD